MLTIALLTLFSAALLFASGRMLLAFLPPGWPGWAPGMGARELGATIGTSWLLGSLAHSALAVLTNLFAIPNEPDAETLYATFIVAYLALHAVLAVALILRAPAKLRPRHETSSKDSNWIAAPFALATLAVASWPIVVATESVAAQFSASTGLESVAFAMEWLPVLGGDLAPLALVLVLVGALGQLGLKSWAAWAVGLGSLVSYLAFTVDPYMYLNNMQVPPLWPAFALTTACVVGLVWARRADRRARTLALLLLSTLTLTGSVEAVPAALVGLCAVLFALPAGGRRPIWPWTLLVLVTPAQLAIRYLMTSNMQLNYELTLVFWPRSIGLPDFEHWRFWLAPPVALLVASWYLSRHSRAKGEPFAARLSWWLVALVPFVLALTAWSDGAAYFAFPGDEPFAYEWSFPLPFLVLGLTPALLVLLAVHFGPRETHATAAAADPS